jgi:hypothetical protein
MWKCICRVVCCAALVAVLAVGRSAALRADDQDYNAYWQEQTETQQQEQIEAQQKQQDYNAYWQEQAEQQPQQQQ